MSKNFPCDSFATLGAQAVIAGWTGRKRQMSAVLLQHLQPDPSLTLETPELTADEQARLIDLAVAHRIRGVFRLVRASPTDWCRRTASVASPANGSERALRV